MYRLQPTRFVQINFTDEICVLFFWYHLLMSLSSVVFPIVCIENITEISVHYYIRFHPQLMNYLVQKYPVPYVVCLFAFLVCLSYVNI